MYEKVIDRFIKLNNQQYERYNSWNHCYSAFEAEKDEKTLSLHLGFYLASWGMYRGSSQLLQKDYLVHFEAVKIIKKYWHLRCSVGAEVNINHLNDILSLIKELSCYYQEKHNVTATDTLISKIILGTLGCLPAFDRYFIDGVKENGFHFKTLRKKSLEELFKYIEKDYELKYIQKKNPQYPTMKIIDMYFWQIGYDLNK
jgi:hypothetical protein